MVKTFDNLVKEHYWNDESAGNVISTEDVLDLLKLVRLKTLEECANKAESDINWLDGAFLNLKSENTYEVYVLKESILQLSKDSIEL
jgi:hypothetical protein